MLWKGSNLLVQEARQIDTLKLEMAGRFCPTMKFPAWRVPAQSSRSTASFLRDGMAQTLVIWGTSDFNDTILKKNSMRIRSPCRPSKMCMTWLGGSVLVHPQSQLKE